MESDLATLEQSIGYTFKNKDLFNKIPVAIITGIGNEDLVQKAYSYPIVDVLRKPFNERDVKSVVEKMI